MIVDVFVIVGVLVIVGVKMSVCVIVEVGMSVLVGAGFGRSRLQDKIGRARTAATRRKSGVLESLNMGKFPIFLLISVYTLYTLL